MRIILGVDEAGRGPLAGPVAVGVVAAREDYDFLAAFPGLNDSKKLTEKKREEIYALLEEETGKGNLRAKVCFSSELLIDRKGISHAIKAALHRGVKALAPDRATAKVFLDGSLKAPIGYEQETIIGGDSTVPAIMLASVIAKVARDRIMVEMAHEYPEYDFATHKGYGTPAHQAAIRAHGLCELHRKSFCTSFVS